MERIEEEFIRAIVLPHEDLQFVGGAACLNQCAFLFNHIGEDTNICPIFLYQFGQLCELDKGRNGGQFDHQPFAIVGAQTVALGITFGQAQLIKHLIGRVGVKGCPKCTVFRTRVENRRLGDHRRTRHANAQEDDLVDLISIYCQRQRPAEVSVLDPLADFCIGLVA